MTQAAVRFAGGSFVGSAGLSYAQSGAQPSGGGARAPRPAVGRSLET
jgi:hypothetical protein